MSTMLPTLLTIDAPAYWAPYLINHDDEAMSADDCAECEAWLAAEGIKRFNCLAIAMDPDGDAVDFHGSFRFPNQGWLQTCMYTYTFEME